jgi:replicative superfamily II helicase
VGSECSRCIQWSRSTQCLTCSDLLLSLSPLGSWITSTKAGTLCVLCATTTLAVGVNLPCQRVILRTCFGWNRQLLPVADYHQMRGRAGRFGLSTAEVKGECFIFAEHAHVPQAISLIHSDLPPCMSQLVFPRQLQSFVLVSRLTTYKRKCIAYRAYSAVTRPDS